MKSFSIRFIGYIGTYVDGGFNMLKQRNVLNFLQDLTCYSAYEQNSPTMVPLINVFCLFLQHKEGWKWINDSGEYNDKLFCLTLIIKQKTLK